MTADDLARQIQLATFFLRRLAGLPPATRAAIPIPGYQNDTYVTDTLQVRTFIRKAGRKNEGGTTGITEQIETFVQRAERALERAGITGELGAIAAEAVRAILIRPLAEAEHWASSVYQPFETVIPYKAIQRLAEEAARHRADKGTAG
jgi:hypothetical protein